MDTEARSALEELSRQAVAPDLDALSVEIERLRHELLAVRQAAGVPYQPPDVVRRERVVAMREAGLSTQAISSALGVARKTVQRDLRVAAGRSGSPAGG